MAIPITIRIEYDPPKAAQLRAVRKIARLAHYRLGHYWHHHYAKGHFKPAARHRYGHQARTKKYQRAKVRMARAGAVEMGGRVDLVFSGRTRELVTKRPLVRGFPNRATVDMHAPDYITRRSRNRSKPDMAKELTTVTPGERRDCEQFLQGEVVEGLKHVRTKKTVTLK